MLFCEGEERSRRLFRHEGQVDVLWREGPRIGAAEQEQCFGRVDRSGVDDVKAFDDSCRVVGRIAAGDVEKRLRDRQWSTQFVGSVSESRSCPACASYHA